MWNLHPGGKGRSLPLLVVFWAGTEASLLKYSVQRLMAVPAGLGWSSGSKELSSQWNTSPCIDCCTASIASALCFYWENPPNSPVFRACSVVLQIKWVDYLWIGSVGRPRGDNMVLRRIHIITYRFFCRQSCKFPPPCALFGNGPRGLHLYKVTPL